MGALSRNIATNVNVAINFRGTAGGGGALRQENYNDVFVHFACVQGCQIGNKVASMQTCI